VVRRQRLMQNWGVVRRFRKKLRKRQEEKLGFKRRLSSGPIGSMSLTRNALPRKPPKCLKRYAKGVLHCPRRRLLRDSRKKIARRYCKRLTLAKLRRSRKQKGHWRLKRR